MYRERRQERMMAAGNDNPRCSHCDYSLLGLHGPKCPECGNQMRAVFRSSSGRKRLSWALTYCGCFLALLSILLIDGMMDERRIAVAVIGVLLEVTAIALCFAAWRMVYAGERLVPFAGFGFCAIVLFLELRMIGALLGWF